MRELDALFAGLAQSRFRRSFHLRGRDLDYLRSKGLNVVLAHGAELIARRLAPAVLPN